MLLIEVGCICKHREKILKDMLFTYTYAYMTTDSKVYKEKQKTQNSRQYWKRPTKTERTDTTWLQDLLQSHSNEDSMVLVKE